MSDRSPLIDHDAATLVSSSPTDEVKITPCGSRPLTIGKYNIVKEIARGGMGVVYLAEQVGLARQVALKTLLIQSDRESTLVNRFAVEAEAVARLDHPGIVTIYEVGQYESQPFLAMKYASGGSLASVLQKGPLSVERTLELAIEIAEAISHAHERGVIHRDIKPANVLLDNDGRAVITDFGVAKFTHAAACLLTTAGEPIGTPHFMPPEQADAGRGVIGPPSDIYSIGAVIYAMLTGRPPFQAASSLDVILQVLSNEPVSPRRLNATVPVPLDAIVMKCLQKEPTRRYRSAKELADDLGCCRDGKPTIAKPVHGIQLIAYQLRRHFMVATVSGSIVTLLLAAALTVIVAHLRLIEKNHRIEGEKADLASVLALERRMNQARLVRTGNEDTSEWDSAVERLILYTSYFKDANPDLAVRTAYELVKAAQEDSIAPPSVAVEVLLSHLKAHSPDSPLLKDMAGERSESDMSTLLIEVKKTIHEELTSEQRFLLGLEDPSQKRQPRAQSEPSE